MSATILDGKAAAAELRAAIRADVEKLTAGGIKPGLAVIIVGENPASRIYVKNKRLDCEKCGILSEEYALPAGAAEAELLGLIAALNAKETIHGILVQLPLPAHMDEKKVLEAIDPRKDVDAFHPENVGRIMIGDYTFAPCTPAGVMALLDRYGIDAKGKNCVVVGRSNIVGKPQAMLLLHRHGTVTICHSRTENLAEVCRGADILVVAVGKRGLVTADMIKPGAAVIDIAMNRGEDGKLTGDVDFEAARAVAGHITPVPGGVGPMTRVMLLQNTLRAARLQNGL